ncbi:disease resistance RPP13-like protein 4 [Rhododendron vialii]|uniref:disease resistance RPP13-like protein 4 n=1 Tax=Rhododendron vialii TaxID=182163 RepID=UPI00265F240C|nr:disease resistance RPP13-like protein 4 [Rhododendron vialii]
MSINEAPPSQSDDSTPSINSTSPSKAKCSIGSLAALFKAKLNISKHKSKPEPKRFELSNRNAASSSATTAANNHDHGGAPALYKLIHQDLSSMEEFIARLNEQINHAHYKLKELKTIGSTSSRTELDELRKLKMVVARLKSQIPSRLKIPSYDSNRRTWPDINKTGDEMIHLYWRPEFGSSSEPEDLQRALDGLPYMVKRYLFCFLIFPPMTIIKRTFLRYWWIANRLVGWHAKRNNIAGKSGEDIGNEIFDMLIAECFIKPVFQKRGLVPDSCQMSHSVHSALTIAANVYLRTFYVLGRNNQTIRLDRYLRVINIGEAIIDGGPQLFEKMRNITIVYLGRRQSLATHHIEVADTKILHGLKNPSQLEFLSLRGISLITELPSFISELTHLKILDLQACHNLELIPDGIGLLQQLTQLDMSECYFLEYMPKSLAHLSQLEVLKGFLIQDSKYDKQSCTLGDLSGLQKLRKLNIYTSVEDFPTERDLNDFQKFEALQKLTISWGGCSSQSAHMQTQDDVMQSLAVDNEDLGIKKQAKSEAEPAVKFILHITS